MNTTTLDDAPAAAMSDRLLVLLRYAKSEHRGSTWRDVAAALGDLYHPEMTLTDVVHHAVAAFSEVIAEPRFRVGRGGAAAEELLLAPIKGYHSVEALGPTRLDAQYTVEQFYNAQIAHVLGQLSIARIDWCRDQYNLALAHPRAAAAVFANTTTQIFLKSAQ